MVNEKILLSNVADGDEHAFRILFNAYRKRVYSYALKLVKSETQAEDILQEVFIKIWEHDNLPEIENFEAYIRTTTRNHTLKILRRQQLEIKNSLEQGIMWKEAHNETEESLMVNDLKKILNKGIDLLPPQQKLVYNLCREQGLKYEAAAKVLSISPLTVKTHMQHSLRFLRNYLSKYTDAAFLFIMLYDAFK